MTAITNIIKTLVDEKLSKVYEDIEKGEKELLKYKLCANYPAFKNQIILQAQLVLLSRSITTEYEVGEFNGPIIKQLYYYITNNPLCQWNLNAGLIFGGKTGCGKTLLMTAYLNVSNLYCQKKTILKHAKEIAAWVKIQDANDPQYTKKTPLFIDDLGQEEVEVKDFGNITKPIIDLLGLRYEAGARTYATTNLMPEKLRKFYDCEGIYLSSRIEEMMTTVHFPGENRRLKNEVKTRPCTTSL